MATGNAGHGLYYEVSSRALIARNRVIGNRRLGVKVSSSDHVRLERNSFAANRVSLGVYNDPRGPESDAYSRALGLRWLTTGTVIVDNTFAQRTSALPFITLGDYKADPERNPPLIARRHGNTFHRTA